MTSEPSRLLGRDGFPLNGQASPPILGWLLARDDSGVRSPLPKICLTTSVKAPQYVDGLTAIGQNVVEGWRFTREISGRRISIRRLNLSPPPHSRHSPEASFPSEASFFIAATPSFICGPNMPPLIQTPVTAQNPAHLFSPLTIGSVTLPNRIVVSPMCEYSCETAWRTTGTSCIWAAARWQAPAWFLPRPRR